MFVTSSAYSTAFNYVPELDLIRAKKNSANPRNTDHSAFLVGDVCVRMRAHMCMHMCTCTLVCLCLGHCHFYSKSHATQFWMLFQEHFPGPRWDEAPL